MYDKNFEIVGLYKSPDGVYTTLFLLQDENGTKHNNERTTGRMALNIPMKTDPAYTYSVGEKVAVGFSAKHKKFYVIKKGVKK